ncbi:hypothetical protein THAOC_30792 [Thalassiosira oceanica]|uniref:BTB domain-containing protein n=1 Tax=Thalassiosira oceanica TaxID=159749 RepID=K0RUF1_THAOC|nr:hypothetical protein THAOC_30792 [Thalassiosira oceanica]|eukprot:EJK50267.1 hypothetical protein THAOC_30792 [Thalassiosira oceanica]
MAHGRCRVTSKQKNELRIVMTRKEGPEIESGDQHAARGPSGQSRAINVRPVSEQVAADDERRRCYRRERQHAADPPCWVGTVSAREIIIETDGISDGLVVGMALEDELPHDDTMTVRVEVGTYHPNKANIQHGSIEATEHGRQFQRLRNTTCNIICECFRVGRPGFQLVDGALILKLVMYADHPPQNASVADEFVPTNPCLGNVLKEYGNEETSDVTIEVGGEEETGTGRRKRARTDSTTFHAHQFVLRCNAPTLAEMCKPGDEATPIRIGNVSPETFKHLLYYCYGGKISDEDLEESAREIIDAADRFGVANLKLEAEAYMVKKETFTVEDILDNLLYADSKNCALLLEKAMDFVVKKKDEIIGKIFLDDLPGTMVMDMLTAISQAQREGNNGDDDIDTMRVSELRRRLHEKGLCVDGSRKAMIALLKENS